METKHQKKTQKHSLGMSESADELAVGEQTGVSGWLLQRREFYPRGVTAAPSSSVPMAGGCPQGSQGDPARTVGSLPVKLTSKRGAVLSPKAASCCHSRGERPEEISEGNPPALR